MKAQNPNGGEPIDINLPSGPEFTRWVKICNKCETCAGGCISGPGLPEPSVNPRSVCPGCGGKGIRLEKADYELVVDDDL